MELSNLVVGIRLFNQEIGKGGAGLFKVEDILNAHSGSLREEAFQELEEIS